MIHFSCKICGQKVKAPEATAGKRARCPKCHNKLIIPSINNSSINNNQTTATTTQEANGPAIIDFMLEPPPRPAKPVDDIPPMVDESDKTTKPIERSCPWLIDIFLYPLCKNGLIMLGIFVGVPLAIELVKFAMHFAVMVLPAMLVFYLLASFIGSLVNLVMFLYIYWYLCLCIRTSAEGEIRAPETIGQAPGLWELIGQIIKIIVALLLTIGPAVTYYLNTRQANTTFWILCFAGATLFPMTLLSVVMFDSITGFNPFIIIGSIFETFFHYLLIVLVFIGIGFFTIKVLLPLRTATLAAYLVSIVQIYLWMVMAHLLGRFYYKNEAKLRWEV